MSPAAPRIRVVLVDDSAFVRRALSRVLAGADDVEVVGEAGDGSEALELVRRLGADVVLLDLAMPVLDGLATLRELLALQRPPAVVVVSGAAQRGAEATLSALEAGAFDFVDKSAVGAMQLHELGGQVLEKLRAAAARRRPAEVALPPPPGGFARPSVVAVGASTGGPQALAALLGKLPPEFAAPVVIVQHMPPFFLPPLVARLGERSALPVALAAYGELLRPGRAYVVPAGADGVLRLAEAGPVLVPGPAAPGASHVPSADALLYSAASALGPAAWGVVLSGMGRDGTAGLLAIRRAGGLTVAQDEATSTVFGMPRAAIEAGAALAVCPVHALARYLTEALERSSASRWPARAGEEPRP